MPLKIFGCYFKGLKSKLQKLFKISNFVGKVGTKVVKYINNVFVILDLIFWAGRVFKWSYFFSSFYLNFAVKVNILGTGSQHMPCKN